MQTDFTDSSLLLTGFIVCVLKQKRELRVVKLLKQ